MSNISCPLLWTVCIVQNSRTFGSFTGLPLDVTAVLRRLSLFRESRGSVEDNYEDKRSTKTVRWRYNTVNFQNFHNRQLIAHQIFMFLNDKLMWYTIQYSGMSDRAIKGFHFICLRGFGDKLYIALYTACSPFIALCGHSCSLLASGCLTHTGSNPVLTKGKRLVYSPFEHVDITSLCHHDCTFIIKQKIPISSYPAVGLSGVKCSLIIGTGYQVQVYWHDPRSGDERVPETPGFESWARFLSPARSKLKLCSADHRTCDFSNLTRDWLSIIWAYSEQERENGPWSHYRKTACRLSILKYFLTSAQNKN